MTSIEDIKIGISKKLNSVFGDDYSIYTEEVKQGFKAPAFFISNIRSSQNQIVGKRYMKNNLLVINFYPIEDGSEEEQCNNMADSLLNVLEYIESATGVLRGTNMSSEVVDKVLIFTAEFNFQILKSTAEEEFMVELEQSRKRRGDLVG